jgi:hypothetical protein
MAWLRALAVTAVIIGIAVILHVSWNSPRDDRPVSRVEAETVLDEAVRLAQAGDFAELCESVAADRGICRNLLQSAEDMGATPGDQPPTVVRTSYVEKSNTRVLHLRGVTGENKPYTADFAVSRESSKGLRAFTVVYWSGVRYDA